MRIHIQQKYFFLYKFNISLTLCDINKCKISWIFLKKTLISLCIYVIFFHNLTQLLYTIHIVICYSCISYRAFYFRRLIEKIALLNLVLIPICPLGQIFTEKYKVKNDLHLPEVPAKFLKFASGYWDNHLKVSRDFLAINMIR